jgi:beta-lactam-binding protein with PASTA domain
MGGITLLFLLLFFYLFLPFYTRQGQSVVVPEISGLSFEEARAQLEAVGLGYSLDTLYEYRPEFPPLAVTQQDPLPNTQVKPGRKIYLYLNKETPHQIAFPDIINKSLFEARAELEKRGLKVGRINYVAGEYPNLVEKATFRRKSLKPGQLLEKYSSIDLVVSEGPGEKVVAIDIVGMQIAEAVSLLQEQGFQVGQIKFDPTSSEPENSVIRQFPAFHDGDSLGRGTVFTLFVAGEEPTEANEAPE